MSIGRPVFPVAMSMETGSGGGLPPWDLAGRRERTEPLHPLGQALLAYCRSKSAPGKLPRRDDILANEIPALLPNLAILEPVPGGGDWRFRLVGTQLVLRYGFDWTGRLLTELFNPPTAQELLTLYNRVAADLTPVFVTGRAQVAGREHVIYETATLPILGRDEATVWMLLGVFFHN
jgi:hypothetical protein